MERITEQERAGHARQAGARPLAAAGVLAVAAGLLAWLAPSGADPSGAVRVTGGPSVSAYRSVAGAAADAPTWVGSLLGAATEGTLVVLGLLLVWVGLIALRRRDARALAGILLAGAATVVAYAASEALKTVLDEERPCRALGAVATVDPCPEPGDWSFPSNHSTLAAALAVGLAVVRPRLAAVTLPLAALAALLRVAVGVHYPHDVLAGVLLGGAVAAAAMLALRPLAVRVVSRTGWARRGSDARFVGHDGRRGAVVHAQPGQDGADVRLDGAFHHVQPPGDLTVGQAGAQMGQHVAFPGGEGGDAFPGGGTAAGRATGAGGRQVGDHTGGHRG
ncbi:hypothetical protein GCM10018779_15570 [Streptomyces griseocarneus]|nr:hypothetical protein GCM10018779_15570 [Streptomyces griseocarneus]